MKSLFSLSRGWRISALLIVVVLLQAERAMAQPAGGGSPWERAAKNLETTFTGPLAESLALVAIVVAGLMWMFGEGGAKRQIAGVVFGGGVALLASTFLRWLF
jgi:type IV secretory pathway VirB2 component (pilin)